MTWKKFNLKKKGTENFMIRDLEEAYFQEKVLWTSKCDDSEAVFSREDS